MTDIQIIKAQHKLNAQADRIELPVAFKNKFPDLTENRMEKYFKRYVDEVSKVLLRRLPFIDENGETRMATSHLFDACRDFQYKNERHYIWNEFKDIYPFFTVTETGSNVKAGSSPYDKNSKVKIYRRAVNMLLEERSPRVVFEELFDGIDLNTTPHEKLPIDMENLENFIGQTAYTLENAADAPLIAKLQKALYQARLIHKIGEHTEAVTLTAYLPMVESKSVYGRTYYTGINIQNVTKQVRSAVIGPHYQYDMNAAVYAIKLAILNDMSGGENNVIDTKVGTYTREYLNEKNAIRKRLAKECFAGVGVNDEAALKYIKNALTAIGFGAKTNAGFWMDEGSLMGSAITQIIRNQDARDRFLNDPWVVNFIAEQHSIEDDIVAQFKAQDGYEATHAELKKANTDKGGNGRVTKSHILAYIYQQLETQMMDEIVDILAAHGVKVIARIHDAFIVRTKVPVRVMDEVIVAMADYSRHITLDCDEVRKWPPVEVKKAYEAHDALAALHKAHIRNEDRMARIYAMKKSGGAA